MAASRFKHYKFKCPECGEEFEKGMWTSAEGKQDGVNCPSCKVHMEYTEETKPQLPMIAMREKWKRKIPGEFRDWMENDFSARHGTDQTINMRDD